MESSLLRNKLKSTEKSFLLEVFGPGKDFGVLKMVPPRQLFRVLGDFQK